MATISIADNDARVQYTQAVTANTTQLTIDFPFFDYDDINVIVTSAAGVDTTLTRGTGTGTFAVTGTSVDDGYSGGYVTLGDTYSDSSTKYTIFRDIDVERTTDFPTSGPFNVSSLNTELDKIFAIEQELETKIGRTMKLADSDSAAELSLPNLDTRKGTVLAFNTTTGLPEAGPEIGDISTIAAITTDIATLADIEDGTDATDAIQTVAGVSSNVTTVASNISSVNTAASNITDIQNAATNAATATTKAAEAATSATNAATSATSASNAQTAAETAQTGAETAQAAAESARDSALAAYDNFDDRYLGVKASDPTLDNDGNALVAGALYFNSTDSSMKVYDGSSWYDAYADGALFARKANNLSDLADAATARTNLGLGTAATSASTDFVAVTGDDVTGNINFGDNVKAQFGASNDLQIYHDGSNSIIQDANGTGNLILKGRDLTLQDYNTGEPYITCINNGAVTAYYDNSAKLATTSTGVTVSGTALATTDTDTTNTGNVTLDFGANQNFVLTLTGNVTLDNPTTEQVGQSGFIVFIQDATGGRTVSLGTDYETAGGAGLTLSTAASTTDIVPYVVAASGRILLGTPQLAFA